MLEFKQLFDLLNFLVEVLWSAECRVRHYVVLALWLLKLCLIVVLVIVDLVNSLGVEPCDPLAVLPKAVLHLAFARVFVDSEPVLLPVVPPAFVLAPVRPEVKAVACLLVFFVLALVGHSISVDVNTHAVHVIIVPVSVILPAILPLVLPDAVDPVIDPVSLVDGAVSPAVRSVPLLFAILVLSDVLRPLRPDFSAVSALSVVLPVTLILGPLLIRIHSVAIALIVVPLALIDISIGVVESAVAARVAHLPLAFEAGTVDPGHCASTVSEPSSHLAIVDGACGLVSVLDVLDRDACIKLLVLVLQGLEQLFPLEVDAISHLHFRIQNSILPPLQETSHERLQPTDLVDVQPFQSSTHIFEVEVLT